MWPEVSGPLGRRPSLPPPSATGGAALSAQVRDGGACITTDPEVFFDDARAELAISLCQPCPVREPCLRHALANEAHGVWGASTHEERRLLRGDRSFHTPEQRREAYRLRELILRGAGQEQVAISEGLNVRTIGRWLLDKRQPTGRQAA